MTMPAILGTMRLAETRLGYVPLHLRAERDALPSVLLNGVDLVRAGRLRLGSLTVTDALNDAPNTAAFRSEGAAPVGGQPLRITVNRDAPRLLFNGTLETVGLTYEGLPQEIVYASNASDDLARLNRLLPFGSWVNVSASIVAAQLLASFAPGFTGTHIQAGLPAISVEFDGSDLFTACLAQIAELIGGYAYIDDLDLHLFTSEASDLPDPIDSTHPFLDDPPISITRDRSQLRTRVYGRGHGEATLQEVAPGATLVPLADAAFFTPTGGRAKSGTQVFAYTGVQLGGPGTLVGPGAQPASAPGLSPAPGSGLSNALYKYAYTFVTPAGESLPSPLGSITTQIFPAPPVPTVATDTTPGNYYNAGGGLVVGDNFNYTYSYSAAAPSNDLTQESAQSAASAVYTAVAAGGAPPGSIAFWNLTLAYSTNPTVKWLHVFMRKNGGAYSLCLVVPNSVAGGPLVVTPAPTAGGATPVPAGGNLQRVTLSGLGLGGGATTARKIYRTTGPGAQLKLLATILNNTATVYGPDAAADGTLGANAPTSDTSGLTQPTGQVVAGATDIQVAGAAAFSVSGGLAFIGGGQQVIRYGSVFNNFLTGVPASGPGSLVATVTFGATITAAPALTGVTGITATILKEAMVNIWVQRDDTVAQALAAAAEGGSGIHEHLVSDERRAEPSLTALCNAELARFSRELVTVTYATRDIKTKSGKPVTITLLSPPISASLVIQDVKISEFGLNPELPPRFAVTASSVRFSLPDLLRQALERNKGRKAM